MTNEHENPVICAVCIHTGKITTLKDGKHLTCELRNNKPIYGSKPKWCPLKESEGKNEI